MASHTTQISGPASNTHSAPLSSDTAVIDAKVGSNKQEVASENGQASGFSELSATVTQPDEQHEEDQVMSDDVCVFRFQFQLNIDEERGADWRSFDSQTAM
jgi:hypothetical protein